MVNDLLSDFEKYRRSPEKSGFVSITSRTSFQAPPLRGGKRSPEAPGLPFPSRTGSPADFSYPPARGAPKNLRAIAIRLANEIEQVEARAASLCAIQEPFKNAFWSAHRTLEDLYRFRLNGPEYPDKTTVLAAYDRRLVAGHQWHPHRKPYEATLRWLKALRTELKQVNSEIGT